MLIMVLNDGKTFTDLEGCQIVRMPDEMREAYTDLKTIGEGMIPTPSILHTFTDKMPVILNWKDIKPRKGVDVVLGISDGVGNIIGDYLEMPFFKCDDELPYQQAISGDAYDMHPDVAEKLGDSNIEVRVFGCILKLPEGVLDFLQNGLPEGWYARFEHVGIDGSVGEIYLASQAEPDASIIRTSQGWTLSFDACNGFGAVHEERDWESHTDNELLTFLQHLVKYMK